MIGTYDYKLTSIYHEEVLLLMFVYMANTSQQQTCNRVLVQISTHVE